MPFHRLRHAVLLATCATSLLLASCGSGTIESQFTPSRVIVFGDGSADMGQTTNAVVTNARYTVNNDSTVNLWTEQVAASYGVVMTTVALGGTSYATGNARVNSKPDAAGSTVTPTVKEQIDTFLAGGAPRTTDLMILSAGIADVITEAAKITAGTQTSDQALVNVRQAGRDLGAQVRRLVLAGASHVMVAGTYDLSRTPWGQGATTLTPFLVQASAKFNEELLLSIVDLGANVLYTDVAFHYNLMIGVPAAYGLVNSIAPVCTSIDGGPGIGIGTGKVNSSLCNTTTLAGAHNTYVFADSVYPTPVAQRKFGDYSYTRIRARW